VSKLLSLALPLAMVAAPALADEEMPVFVSSAPVKDKPVVTLDPARGYVMLRTDVQTPIYLMKVPTAKDQAAYDRLRAAAFAEAREKYEKKQKAYERARAAYAKNPGFTMPEKPFEPTEANFQFTAFNLIASASFGPMNRFAKGEGGASTYLQEITPGEYRIYGPIFVGPQAMMGACYCMGSVKFEVRAGEITDMGVILSKGVELPKAPPGDSSMPVWLKFPDFLGAAPSGYALDPRLKAYTVRRAAYRPVGKLPNYFGITLSRIPEMPGVLRYERDRIVDLTGTR